MNEKLQDKVVAIELAGNNIFIANDNDNFKNELISIGFEKVGPYYSLSSTYKCNFLGADNKQ